VRTAEFYSAAIQPEEQRGESPLAHKPQACVPRIRSNRT
jgi:hypothetical protein